MPTLDVLIASDTSHRELGPLLRERSNYRVTFANNYAEAVVLLRALRVSVVLIDAQLDDGKGFELAEFVHKSLPETEIVLVADKNLDRDSAEVFGAFAVMSDVVSHAELAFKIEQALAHHRLRMEQATLTRTATEMDAMSAMGKLALHLAHEIRNPLNAAVLQLHLLERDVEKLVERDQTEGPKRRIRIVETELQRLNRLLTEFLELSRPQDLSRVRFDVALLLNDVLELERELLRQVDVRVRKCMEAELIVEGDPEKLKQVFLNLMVNAADAMPTGGTLDIATHREGDSCKVDLIDSGRGIPEETLSKVFDPFFTTKEAGTGLGLPIVRRIVDSFGGQIEIGSVVGKGTRVRITLPLARAQNPAA